MLFKGFKDAANPNVKRSHHPRKLSSRILGEGLVVAIAPHLVLEFREFLAEGSGVFLRNMHGGVRDGDREKAEKRTLVLGIDPFHGPVHDEIMRVGFSIELYFPEVVKKPGGVIGVSIALAVVAEEAVEALVDGIAFRTRIAQAPLSEGTRGITGLFQCLRDGEG